MRSCVLQAAEIHETALRGLDVTRCDIGGMTVDLPAVRGMRVTEAQALQLSALLGLNVVQ